MRLTDDADHFGEIIACPFSFKQLRNGDRKIRVQISTRPNGFSTLQIHELFRGNFAKISLSTENGLDVEEPLDHGRRYKPAL